DGRRVIFQAEEKDTGNPFYQIFVQDLAGGVPRRISPGVGRTTCSYFRPDGKKVIFASSHLDPDAKKHQAEEYARRAEDRKNGVPFFSPDGQRVVFRSDRKEKDRLQLYVINADGTGERALTDNPHWVYWAPYWYKDGKHIIYTAADHSVAGRPNYDLYWMNV